MTMDRANRQSDDEKPKRRMSEASLANLKGGSRKGVPNKLARAAKEVIAAAAEELGGTERLVEWVKEDPKNEATFWGSIYPRLIPVQLANPEGETFKVESVNDANAFTSGIIGLTERIRTEREAGITQH